jgi:hypothetical protein
MVISLGQISGYLVFRRGFKKYIEGFFFIIANLFLLFPVIEITYKFKIGYYFLASTTAGFTRNLKSVKAFG